ncbi:MAG: type II secretion system protein [bacterium]|nr:type II secretion system protein [bacterium]
MAKQLQVSMRLDVKNKFNFSRFRAFTLTEILIVAAILALIGLAIAQLIRRSSRQFTVDAWNQKVVYQMESAIQRLNKYLRLASYPTLNTFKGVIRDRSDTYACKIENSNLERNEAYSQNTTSLSEGQGNGGGVIYDSGSARYHFFGSGIKEGLSEDFDGGNRYKSSSTEQNIMEWTSCRPGFADIPGFANTMPRCGQHRLFLKNRQKVWQPMQGTYLHYQDLFLETGFCYSKTLSPENGDKGYITGKGIYGCDTNDFQTKIQTGMQDDEKNSVGLKLLISGVATVTVKVFEKDNERSKTLEIDFTAVAPMHGQRVVKRSTQVNISTNVIESGTGFSGN